MPLPVAHALAGATIVAALCPRLPRSEYRRNILVGGLLGVCPDFDYALNMVPGLGGGWHHSFTHSFAFSVLIGLMAAALSGRFRPGRVLMYGLAAASHPLLDYLFTESRGVELLWPLTAQRHRLRLPYPIDYDWRIRPLWACALDVLKLCTYELMMYAPALIVTLWVRSDVSRRSVSG